MPFDLLSALKTSPYREQLAAAAAYIAAGRYVEAVHLLEETVAKFEMGNAPSHLIVPFLQLSAEGLRNAAARFASANPYSSRVDQRMRIGWLEQALAIYQQLHDVPNQVAVLRALASANFGIGEALAAMYQLKEVANLALPDFILDADELRQLFGQLADACQVAYEKGAEHRMGLHYNLAVEGAAYRYLSGDPVQSMLVLDALHERYLQAAQSAHKIGSDERALKLLAEGICWGLVTGHSDVLNQHADLLVNYAAQAGHASAVTAYDRAIVLRRAGSYDLAQRLVMEQSTFLLDKFSSALSLKLFHDIVDFVTQYRISAADHALKDVDSLDPKLMVLAGAKREATLLQLTAWAQTLHALVPVFLESENRLIAEAFIEAGFTISLQQAHPAFSDADLRMREYYHAMSGAPTPPVSVELLRAVTMIQWSDPASVQLICALLARHLNCTPAEVELALMPRGVGSPAERRIRQTLGDFNWERIRRAAIVRGMLDQHRIWQERGIPFRGRR